MSFLNEICYHEKVNAQGICQKCGARARVSLPDVPEKAEERIKSPKVPDLSALEKTLHDLHQIIKALRSDVENLKARVKRLEGR